MPENPREIRSTNQGAEGGPHEHDPNAVDDEWMDRAQGGPNDKGVHLGDGEWG